MRWRELLGWSVLFAVAHTQGPLDFSNQNQYLLHGAAAGGHGHLAGDWLANTADPTPLFSWVVAVTFRFLDPFLVHVYYFALLMGYFVAAAKLMEAVPGFPAHGPGRWLGFALVLAAHAAIFRWLSVQLTGVDYPWLLQVGLAGQYALGPGFQPSAAGGVMLFAGLAAAVHRRPFLAVAFAAGGAVVHSTYLLPAAMLTAGVMVPTAQEGGRRRAVGVGLLALLIVAPVALYTLTVFGPTSPKMFGLAQNLIALKRIPHHALVHRWLDGPAVFTLAWMAAGLVAARRTPAGPVLVTAAALGFAMTLPVAVTESTSGGLLFPWRVSIILVPAATALLAARLAARINGRGAAAAAVLVTVAAVGGGIAVTALGLGYWMNPNELGLLRFVRETAKPGDVYLIPARYPDLLAGPKGNPSASFVVPKPKPDTIPVDLQRFRLATGAPVYVDFKSIPYKDTDVIEWDRRLKQVQEWYARREWGADIVAELRAEGITHVVATADRDVSSPELEQVFADDVYRVYRIK